MFCQLLLTRQVAIHPTLDQTAVLELISAHDLTHLCFLLTIGVSAGLADKAELVLCQVLG
jgi:hypothetical protein